MSSSNTRSALLGAAFLMATSAIGPGFITQTTVFTQKLLTSFGFVILISILLDIAGQLNIWRVITVSGMRAQDLANNLLPGSGYLLAALVLLGGLAFNIGNVAGAGLGLNILFPLDADPARPVMGACLSAGLALVIFWVKEVGTAMDWFTRILGFVMIALTLYVAIASHPPVGEAVLRTFVPVKIDTTAIVTLVGGTVGGYISFAGAHRLLDAGIQGKDKLPLVTKSSVSAILLASAMRILLFLASLGVIVGGGIINKDNPAGSVFQLAAGQAGYYIFGIVLWAAAITSVVGSAYTSISFLRTFHPFLEKHYRILTTVFIVVSTTVFVLIGKPPVKLLVLAGALNGLILPLALGLMLLAVYKQKLVGSYKHPVWISTMGWLVVIVMSWMGVKAVIYDLATLWK
ncbi:NRAMP family divalent metal transporter [Pseudoflavitalea rhizosphaerae]|uniref:NRAMP family divalent metal transporter n=1 Tax=Pseudoflavitalea rhizosphaerae TaxID=1884793 RepID=UPI001F49FBAA|nr:NRAMP family divalent metal transporter [Pseudoflavitalea rhizosphaerae]